MTTFESLVSMADILLRARGEWQGGATAYADIDWAVNRCSDLLPESSRNLCEMAIAELKRRSAFSSVACPHCRWGFAPSVINQHIKEKHQ